MAGAIKGELRRIKRYLRHFPHRGKRRFCPVCEVGSRTFAPAGAVPRQDATCVYCGARERHRLVWLYFNEKTDLFDGREKKVLHVAPEAVFLALLEKRLGAGYLTADLVNPHAMVKMDITDIRYPDASFDVIYCSHVLEHVPDDRRAMREFRRVLKPDGWAVLLVPVSGERTFEDPSITDPAERAKAFGQADHVRRYGPDYADRLEEAGFQVRVFTPSDVAEEEDVVRMGLTPAAGEIYLCTPRVATR